MTNHLKDVLALNVTNYRFSDVGDFNDFYNDGPFVVNGLFIVEINARSIDSFAKFNKFKRFLLRLVVKVNLVIVGETCFGYETASLHNLHEYDHYPSCRESAGGGVSLYVRTDLLHRFVEKTDDSIYSVTIELQDRQL